MPTVAFDLLHYGHLLHLQEAAKLGDYLVVALTLDEYVGKKPGMPIHPWEHRAALLRELRCVDEVVPSRSGVEVIHRLSPHIFVKGIDYSETLAQEVITACADEGAQIVITQTPKYSTSALITKMMKVRK